MHRRSPADRPTAPRSRDPGQASRSPNPTDGPGGNAETRPFEARTADRRDIAAARPRPALRRRRKSRAPCNTYVATDRRSSAFSNSRCVSRERKRIAMSAGRAGRLTPVFRSRTVVPVQQPDNFFGHAIGRFGDAVADNDADRRIVERVFGFQGKKKVRNRTGRPEGRRPTETRPAEAGHHVRPSNRKSIASRRIERRRGDRAACPRLRRRRSRTPAAPERPGS